MSKKQFFFVEITDTFGGEANYSWVTRHKVCAVSMLGAVQKIARESGYNWRKVYDSGDQSRYDSASGATCFFIEPYDEESHGRYALNEI